MDFRAAYQKANGTPTSDGFSAYSFDAWLVFLDAAKRAMATGAKPGTPEFRVALRNAIFSTKDLVGTHAIYNYKPGDSYGVDERALVLVRLVNGQWKYEPCADGPKSMNGEIAAILAMDGIASGAIYVLIGLGLVLIFAVTRVIFVPFGDIAAFTALTLASLEAGGRPGTVGLVAVLAVLATAVEATALARNRAFASAAARVCCSISSCRWCRPSAVWFAAGTTLSMPLRIVLSLALVLPIAPLLDRIVFRPIADASVLLLLTVAVALHFALSRARPDVLRPEGVRTKPLADAVLRPSRASSSTARCC